MKIWRSADIVSAEFGDLEIVDYGEVLGDDRLSVALVEVPAGGGRHSRAFSRRSDKLYLVISGEMLARDGLLPASATIASTATSTAPSKPSSANRPSRRPDVQGSGSRSGPAVGAPDVAVAFNA